MSHRIPMHQHPRAITLDLGLVTATIGGDDSSSAAPTSAAPSSADSSSSKDSKSTKTTKDVTSSKSSASSSSFPDIAAPSTTSSTSSSTTSSPSSSTTSSTSSSTPTSTTSSITATSTISQLPAAATTSAAASSSHSSGTSPGLVAFAVLVSLAFVGAVAWVLILRRQHKQREWTFQQHQRIFERFDTDKTDDNRPNNSRTVESMHSTVPAAVVDDGTAWSAGTGASVITTGLSVIRKLDWDQGPEKTPQEVIEKPKRKPVPPPKEIKKKTFSQYLPYLLPQNQSVEVIELGKAQQQIYQRPIYKPVG